MTLDIVEIPSFQKELLNIQMLYALNNYTAACIRQYLSTTNQLCKSEPHKKY